ncbi:XRE family transcriptional regulator [Brevibacillus brevis]|uniref:XRE family transcriptional regulator n=1 Tax=Brevibacillus brevis TaxID=1393 RepID=A0ABY9T500_BREBE|nr:XRE family transcriptional regulator [Brevibacillus brevis]WNC15172.1 XRE family transcriptional regulator [Brevibacillus brevis]
MENSLGPLIKELRLQRKMTLKQLSEKTSLSISFLSQVERSKCSVRIESLTHIAEALGVNPSYFFSERNQPKGFIRRAGSSPLPFRQSSFTYTGLSGDIPNPLFEPVLVTLLPNNQKVTSFTHDGQEFIYVLEGVLTVIFGQEEYELFPGDSFHTESNNPHNWYNRTQGIVKLLCVYANSRQT